MADTYTLHIAGLTVIGGAAGGIGDGLRRFDAQERPCTGGNVGGVSLHRDALHRRGRVVGGAEDALYSVILTEHRTRLLEPWEDGRQTER